MAYKKNANEIGVLWQNEGNKYFSGEIRGEKVIGFLNTTRAGKTILSIQKRISAGGNAQPEAASAAMEGEEVPF
jgi:hypothetical protein